MRYVLTDDPDMIELTLDEMRVMLYLFVPKDAADDASVKGWLISQSKRRIERRAIREMCRLHKEDFVLRSWYMSDLTVGVD